MRTGADSRGSHKVWIYAAFAALAILAGPGSGLLAGALVVPMRLRLFAGLGLASLIAGVMLIAYTALRRQGLPSKNQSSALVLLLIPQWCAVPFSSQTNLFPWLHGLGWGTALLLGLAAPLWLGLLASLGAVHVDVPRSIVAAAIIGMAAVFFVIPVDADSVAWKQVPALLLQVLLGIAMVASWVIARPQLKQLSAASAAGWYLLLSSLGDLVFALVYERSSQSPVDWRAALVPLAGSATLFAAVWWLWFWLFERMTLAAFSMRAMAVWVASVLPGFAAYGLGQWRMDVAVPIAIAAIVLALRAGPTEQPPLTLGLRSG